MFILEKKERNFLSDSSERWVEVMRAKTKAEIRAFMRQEASKGRHVWPSRMTTVTKHGATAVTYQVPLYPM